MKVEWINATEGSQTIQYYCLPWMQLAEVIIAKCTVTGTWNPDPKSVNCSVTQSEVEGNAVPSNTNKGDSLLIK